MKNSANKNNTTDILIIIYYNHYCDSTYVCIID